MSNIFKKGVECLKKMWYSRCEEKENEKGNVFEGDLKMGNKVNNKGILDARSLACYIIKYYKTKFNKDDISPLKLQKSLYFCFAYWGGFIRKNKSLNNEIKEIEMDYNEILFGNKIEAWVYGPVVPDVYQANRSNQLTNYEQTDIFSGDEYLQEYIDNVLDDILPVNDFKLVEISHEDQCWKKHFKGKNMFHNIEIPKEEIIREYVKNC